MSKTNLVPWTILDEAAAAKCGHFPGVRVNPTKEPSIGVSFTLKTLEPAPILAAAEKLAEMPTAKLDAGVAALPTRAAVQEAAGQVEAATARLATLLQRADEAQARVDDPLLCADDNGATELVRREAQASAAQKLAAKQQTLVDAAQARLQTAASAHSAAAAEVTERERAEHHQGLLLRRDEARARLTAAVAAAAADFAVASAALDLGHWQQTLSAAVAAPA